MIKQVYITSPAGCISTRGAIKDNLTTREGNIRVWESEESALKSIKIARGTAESILDGNQMALKEAKEEFPEFVEMYSNACKKMENVIEFYNSCEIKELRYN